MTIAVSSEDLVILREWLNQMPHLPSDLSDGFLHGFLRGCKGSIQKAKQKIDNFITLPARQPRILGDIDIQSKSMTAYLDGVIHYTLERKFDDAEIELWANKDEVDPHTYHSDDYYKVCHAGILMSLMDNSITSAKKIYIMDCRGTQLAHLRNVTPTDVKAFMEALQNACPSRTVGIHLLNIPKVVEWMFFLAKGFLTKKLADRMFLHSSLETLLEHVPREYLPKEYGGNELPRQEGHDIWRRKLEDHNEKLMKEYAKWKALDEYRPRMSDDEEMMGTFKKLNVD